MSSFFWGYSEPSLADDLLEILTGQRRKSFWERLMEEWIPGILVVAGLAVSLVVVWLKVKNLERSPVMARKGSALHASRSNTIEHTPPPLSNNNNNKTDNNHLEVSRVDTKSTLQVSKTASAEDADNEDNSDDNGSGFFGSSRARSLSNSNNRIKNIKSEWKKPIVPGMQRLKERVFSDHELQDLSSGSIHNIRNLAAKV